MTAVNGYHDHDEVDSAESVDGIAVDEEEPILWGEIWDFYQDRVDWELPSTLSKTQLATAIVGHPDIAIHSCAEAKKLIDRTAGGPIVETKPHSARYVVREDFDAPI